MTQIINQFLKTATNGNVIAEFAVGTNRWRMRCNHCGITLTMSEIYDIETEYARNGRLDAGVQMFAKDHRHDPLPSFDPSNKTVTYNTLPKLGQGTAFEGAKLLEQQKLAEAKYQDYLKLKQAQDEKIKLQMELNVQAVKQQQLEAQKKQLAQMLAQYEFKNPEGIIQNGTLTEFKIPVPYAPPPPAPKPVVKPEPPPIKEGRKFR